MKARTVEGKKTLSTSLPAFQEQMIDEAFDSVMRQCYKEGDQIDLRKNEDNNAEDEVGHDG